MFESYILTTWEGNHTCWSILQICSQKQLDFNRLKIWSTVPSRESHPRKLTSKMMVSEKVGSGLKRGHFWYMLDRVPGGCDNLIPLEGRCFRWFSSTKVGACLSTAEWCLSSLCKSRFKYRHFERQRCGFFWCINKGLGFMGGMNHSKKLDFDEGKIRGLLVLEWSGVFVKFSL